MGYESVQRDNPISLGIIPRKWSQWNKSQSSNLDGFDLVTWKLQGSAYRPSLPNPYDIVQF